MYAQIDFYIDTTISTSLVDISDQDKFEITILQLFNDNFDKEDILSKDTILQAVEPVCRVVHKDIAPNIQVGLNYIVQCALDVWHFSRENVLYTADRYVD